MHDRSCFCRVLLLMLCSVTVALGARAQCSWSGTDTNITTPCLVGIGTTAPNFLIEALKSGATSKSLVLRSPRPGERSTSWVEARAGPPARLRDHWPATF